MTPRNLDIANKKANCGERSAHDEISGSRWTRLAWFAGLWLASVAVLGVVAFVIRGALID